MCRLARHQRPVVGSTWRRPEAELDEEEDDIARELGVTRWVGSGVGSVGTGRRIGLGIGPSVGSGEAVAVGKPDNKSTFQ